MENQRMNKDGCLLFNNLIISDICCIFFALYSLGLLSEKKFSKESWRNLSIDGKILVVF